jgi:hemerythrin
VQNYIQTTGTIYCNDILVTKKQNQLKRILEIKKENSESSKKKRKKLIKKTQELLNMHIYENDFNMVTVCGITFQNYLKNIPKNVKL